MKGLKEQAEAHAKGTGSYWANVVKSARQAPAEFTIYMPGGEPVLCRRLKTVRQINQAKVELNRWHEFLCSDEARIIPGMSDALDMLDGGKPTFEETVYAYLLKSCIVDPPLDEVNAVHILSLPSLFTHLVSQVEAHLEAIALDEIAKGVEAEGEDSGGTDGTTPVPPSASSEVGTPTT